MAHNPASRQSFRKHPTRDSSSGTGQCSDPLRHISQHPRPPRSGCAPASRRDVVLVLPTPIDFGSIFTSSTSGSWSRRASTYPPQASSESVVRARHRPDRIHRTPVASLTRTASPVAGAGRRISDQFVASKSSFARCGAVSDSDQLDTVACHERNTALAASHLFCGWCGRWRRCRPPCLCCRPQPPSRRYEIPVQAERGAVAP